MAPAASAANALGTTKREARSKRAEEPGRPVSPTMLMRNR
jgi:hypothetical protein